MFQWLQILQDLGDLQLTDRVQAEGRLPCACGHTSRQASLRSQTRAACDALLSSVPSLTGIHSCLPFCQQPAPGRGDRIWEPRKMITLGLTCRSRRSVEGADLNLGAGEAQLTPKPETRHSPWGTESTSTTGHRVAHLCAQGKSLLTVRATSRVVRVMGQLPVGLKAGPCLLARKGACSPGAFSSLLHMGELRCLRNCSIRWSWGTYQRCPQSHDHTLGIFLLRMGQTHSSENS